jgi:Transmembrane domain of unknown function (DUF3566)
VSTEEDGVDEPVRSTQPSLIMASPGLEADPAGEATDAVVDNDIMSSSRARAGSSRSAAGKRDGGANGDALSVDAATAAKDATDATSGTAAPLPADTIGKVKKAGAADQKAEADPSAAPAKTAVPETSAVKSSSKPSFTPSVSRPASTPAAPSAPPASAASPAPARPSAAPSSYPGAGSSYGPSASYPRRDQPAGARSPAPSAPGRGSSASNGSSPGAASAGAASAVTGAAAGLASSVASAWQRRGSNGQPAKTRGTQVRKPARRQAMLTLARVEPWSVMKFSFVASVVAFIILFVAVAVLYMILAALGVFDSLQHTVSSITGAQGSSGTDISHYYSASVVLGYTAMLGALNIVLITAMSTVGSVIYNLIAKTVGGIEVTLRETE